MRNEATPEGRVFLDICGLFFAVFLSLLLRGALKQPIELPATIASLRCSPSKGGSGRPGFTAFTAATGDIFLLEWLLKGRNVIRISQTASGLMRDK